MKKLFLFSATLALVGCLNTQTRNPMHQPSNASSAAVVSSGSAPRSGSARTDSGQSDEEYFQENSFRWPDDWQQRHSQPPAPEPQPSEPPHGELY